MHTCTHHKVVHSVYTTLISGMNIPYNQGYRPRLPSYVVDILTNRVPPDTHPGTLKEKIIQTMFRESETQTDPYDADVQEPVDKGLEILTLGWLSWNNGLPAGMREVVIIERARQRRAWERALPVPADENAKEIRNMIIEAMEINEWTFREAHMAVVASLRMELARKCMEEKLAIDREKVEEKLCRYISAKNEEKDVSIEKARSQLKRDIRKLSYERNGLSRRYKRRDVLFELGNKTSEYYGPQARFGIDPRRGHEVIPPEFRYWNVLSNFDVVRQSGSVCCRREKVKFDYEKNSKPVGRQTLLCIHETHWTDANLQNLYDNLKIFRMVRNRNKTVCRLKVKIRQGTEGYKFPEVKEPAGEEDELTAACLYLQKTIKGRAIQTAMFEGRVRCQELLDELRSTHALQKSVGNVQKKSRNKMFDLHRSREVGEMMKKRKSEILQALQGKTISEILDFLSKELLRLQEERITHAFALLADRERHRREAQEAGRRQAEEQRRREHQEINKQLIKVHQNSTMYLVEEIEAFMVKYLGGRKARKEAEALARNIDLAAQEAHQRSNELEEEEIIADLVHNFALPEAEKEIVRKRLRDRQLNKLVSCHDVIYSEIESAVLGNRDEDGRLRPLPKLQKHKAAVSIGVKFLRLKRAEESLSSSQDSTDSVNPQFQSVSRRQFNDCINNPTGPYCDDADDWSTGFSPQTVEIH